MIIFKLTADNQYQINDVQLSKSDLCLFLEVNQFNVIRNLPDGIFYMKCLNSLSRLTNAEFEDSFREFMACSEADKIALEVIVRVQKCLEPQPN